MRKVIIALVFILSAGVAGSVSAAVVDASCPFSVAVGQPLDVTMTISNWGPSPVVLKRAMVFVGGNAKGTLGGASIFGPYQRYFGANPVTVPTGPPGTATKKLRILKSVPLALKGKMAVAGAEFMTSDGQGQGGATCMVHVR